MRERNLDFVYTAISAVFHPLIYPTLAAVMLFTSDTYFSLFEIKAKLYVIGLIFVCTYLVPLLSMPLLFATGAISSVTMENRRERSLPLLVTGSMFYLAYFLLKKYEAIVFLNIFILTSCIAVIAALFITYWWKISLHTIGIGGFLAAVVQHGRIYGADTFVLFAVFLLLAGVIGSARLAAQAHSPNQVFAGFLSGFLLMFGVMQIFFLA